MKKIGLYLLIMLFPVSVSANNYEQIGDKRQSIEINNFFSDVKKENITSYEEGDFSCTPTYILKKRYKNSLLEWLMRIIQHKVASYCV